ncbi:conserved hypothetical pox protein [Squirrelpox virus]|uniref:A16L n=1 Tax=Squirrelpox virus TaxID=240426 RepID=Q1HTS8_9POXV|nr:conserved hypothetical pox protein [Squirrelpox virus]ABD51458.1 A16L [Squirrelpox virus]CCD83207.1 conserved hypothetical pox protein [Squirrelpox virus]
MLPVKSLRDAVRRHSGAPTRAFRSVPTHDAVTMVRRGFHPRVLPRTLYKRMVDLSPSYLYLFRPQHVPFRDLICALSLHTNVEFFESHVEFHKPQLLRDASSRVVARCVPYMTLVDDDVRVLLDRFGEEEGMEILTTINARSVAGISYVFSDEVAEAMIVNDIGIAQALYDHQTFSREFLIQMLFTRGVVPANEGMAGEKDPSLICKILSVSRSLGDTIRMMDILDAEALGSDHVKDFVMELILGGNVDAYVAYAQEYLHDRAEDMGVYANIFFDDRCRDVSEFELSRAQLEVVCAHINRYSACVGEVAATLIEGGHLDLLASILELVPRDLLSEDLCERLVVAVGSRVRVKHLPVHTERVLAVCVEAGCEDTVDFLDALGLDTLVAMGADPLTDYVLSTTWLNDDPDLLKLFVRRFGFCGSRMRKLVFEYPLDGQQLMNVLELMVEGEERLDPRVLNTLPFLLCSRDGLALDKPAPRVCLPVCREQLAGYHSEFYGSKHSRELRVAVRAFSVEGLRACLARDLCHVPSANGFCVQYRRPTPWKCESERICMQMFDVARLATNGLFHLPTRYLPEWTPAVAAAKGGRVLGPARFEHCSVLRLSPAELVDYSEIGAVTIKEYALSGHISNYHAGINALMGTLMAYLVLGACRHVLDPGHVPRFVEELLLSFRQGLKLKMENSEPPLEACAEVLSLRSIAPPAGAIHVPQGRLDATAALCSRLCAEFVLCNNTGHKSQS